MTEKGPAYVQCVCPKHGPTTFLHADQEKDDWCLLKPEKEIRTPRTWTLRGHEDEHGHREVAVDFGPALKADRKYINCESVRVVEANPVADLLEWARPWLLKGEAEGIRLLDDLLRALGRLAEPESKG